MRIDESPRDRDEPVPDPRARRPIRLHLVAALASTLAVAWVPARAADVPRPADELLRLVPPDASLVLVLEGLRDQVHRIAGSPLVADLRRLPAVKSWLESEKYRHLERSCAEVEAALGVRLPEIRDRILGDAVVLALRLPPGGPPDPSQARGLLLLRARDPSLLERLVTALNAAQREGGELERVEERRRGSLTYHVREFPEGSGRPPEWYVSYPDGTFAFSNSEEMIRGVIDRKPADPAAVGTRPSGLDRSANGPGLGASPRLIAVRRRLPERPIASLYIDPRAVERLLAAAPRPEKPSDLRLVALFRRHLAAVDYAGAALVWRADAIVVHAVETLDATRVDGWLRRWAGDARMGRPDLRRVPRTAILLASAHVDLTALRGALYEAVPSAEHQRLRNFEILLTGLLLGHDVRQFLPALGPCMIAYLDGPAEPDAGKADGPARGGLFPLVVVVDLAAGAGDEDGRSRRGVPPLVEVADSLENALRTVLAMVAMDEKHGRGRAAIAAGEAAGVPVQTLDIPIPFAYAIDRPGGRLVLGTSASSVARYLQGASNPEAGARFRECQALAFPGYETFVCIDLDAVTRMAGRYRGRLAGILAARQDRPAPAVEGDLDHVLALARLFRAAFIASRIEPDASALHRRVGVILRESRAPSAEP